MFRMSWLSGRLALALFAVPATACSGGGQTTSAEQPSRPTVHSQWQWCGTASQAWAQSREVKPPDAKKDVAQEPDSTVEAKAKAKTKTKTKTNKKPVDKDKVAQNDCPTEIQRDLEAWQYDASKSESHKQDKRPDICCFDRGPKVVPPPPPDAGPPDAIRRIYRGPVKGRPLVIGESFTHADVIPNSGWHRTELFDEARGAALPADVRAEVGRRWLDAALAEHAAIASFARSAIELLAVGAPPELVARAQHASIDEIEHARLCFAIASSYAGQALSAGALQAAPPRDLDLAGIAITTFQEGCVCETIAALEAAALIARTSDPAVRKVLETIRDDEARHAELAWATVGWAVRSGGPGVYAALREAAQMLAPDADDIAEPTAIDAILGEHGVMCDADHNALTASAWADVITPLLDRLTEVPEIPDAPHQHA